ncbi:MAG: hypothetical protein AB3N12_01605 [Ruegeria sp.]
MIEVKGSGRSFAGYLNGVRVTRPYWNKETALKAADRIEKQRKSKDRLCLHCRTVFTSEGPHHRLCNDCRRL